jgi:predicted ATP-dependent serine protease
MVKGKHVETLYSEKIKLIKMKYFFKYSTYEKRLTDRVMSAQDLIQSTDENDILQLTGIYETLFGKPSKNFDLSISGAPSSGKTTFLLKFAHYLANNFGKVLYVSSEEFGSVTLVDKLKELTDGELSENLFFAKGMTDMTDYKFVIIDSITDLGLEIEDYKELRDIYTETAFIVVLQHTKSGDYRGSKEWQHEVEIFSDIEQGVVYVTKNRYGVYGAYDFFNKEIVPNTRKEGDE